MSLYEEPLPLRRRDPEWEARHSEGVAEAVAALEGRGLVVDALRLPTSTRLAFTTTVDPSESVGLLVVETRNPAVRSDVGASSIPGVRYVATRDLARRLAEDDGVALAAATLDYPTNAEVRRAVALHDFLPLEAVARLASALREYKVQSFRRALLFPESALRDDYLLAVAVLGDLASGVPAEWAVRRVLGSGGDS